MEDVVFAKGIESFVHHYKFPVFKNCAIIRAEVKTEDISAKIISDKDVKVFGYYDISICYGSSNQYSSNFKQQKHHYQASCEKKFFLSERKAFSEKIDCQKIVQGDPEKMKDLKVKYTFISGPDHKENVLSPDPMHTFIQLEIFGELMVELISDEIENTSQSQNTILPEEPIPREQVDKEVDKQVDKEPDKEVALVRASFYRKENDCFIRRGGTSQKKESKQKKNVKEVRKKFKNKKVANAEPIESKLFEIKENLSINEILKMDLETLQKMQEKEENVSIDEQEEKVEVDQVHLEEKKVNQKSEEMINVDNEEETKKTSIPNKKEKTTTQKRIFI